LVLRFVSEFLAPRVQAGTSRRSERTAGVSKQKSEPLEPERVQRNESCEILKSLKRLDLTVFPDSL